MRNNYPLSPISFLLRAACNYPDKIAIVDGSKSFTYYEMLSHVQKLATLYKDIGVKKGEKIAYLCDNHYQLLLGFYAVPFIEAVIVPINVRLDAKNIRYILEHSEAKVLVADPRYYCNSYSGIINRCFTTDKYVHDELNHNLELLEYNESMDENSIISLNYTSGTTGAPKGVLVSHRSAYLNSLGECIHANLNNSTRYLWVLPLYHCNGWCFSWAVTAMAGTHIFCDSDSTSIINTLVSQNITHFCAAPTVLIKLRNSENFYNIKNLTIITAGSSPSEKILESYIELNCNVIHVYGLTESLGPFTICEYKKEWDDLSIQDRAKKIKKQGIASIHGQNIKVVTTDFNEVPKDGKSLGEIVIKGNTLMSGYYKDTEGTNRAFIDGWFMTGDIAVMHDDGYIEIVDRKKDLIISGGENIPSITIEQALASHENVAFVAVVPMEDTYWGEVPHAFIEIVNDIIIPEDELREICNNNIPKFMHPKKYTFCVLPKTSTGKIKKHLLKSFSKAETYQNAEC